MTLLGGRCVSLISFPGFPALGSSVFRRVHLGLQIGSEGTRSLRAPVLQGDRQLFVDDSPNRPSTPSASPAWSGLQDHEPKGIRSTFASGKDTHPGTHQLI